MTRSKILLVLACLVFSIFVGSAASLAAPKIMAIDAAGNIELSFKAAGITDYTLVQTEEVLLAEMAKLDTYKVIAIGYHEINNSEPTRLWFTDNMAKIVAWVKAGGSIVATVRDDPNDNIILEPFGLAYATDPQTTTYVDITDKAHPIFNTPNKIDMAVMSDEVTEFAAADPTYSDVGLDPGTFKVVAVYPDTDLPVIVVGSVGKGKALFINVELFSATFAVVPENVQFVANVIDYARK